VGGIIMVKNSLQKVALMIFYMIFYMISYYLHMIFYVISYFQAFLFFLSILGLLYPDKWRLSQQEMENYTANTVTVGLIDQNEDFPDKFGDATNQTTK
jgi:hypothetical protein